MMFSRDAPAEGGSQCKYIDVYRLAPSSFFSMHKYRATIHGGLFVAILMVINTAFAFPWPWYLVLPILVYGGIVLAIGPMQRTAPGFAVGRWGGRPLLVAAAIMLGAASVLIGFQVLARPDVSSLAAKIPVESFGNLFLAGLCFSVVNAIAEEVIFRGILWDVIADEWNEWTALGVTSLLFGIGHLDGYPPRMLGVVLAGAYGVALGALVGRRPGSADGVPRVRGCDDLWYSDG
ncbi:MAG: CPBP family intramembrane metalloprotease [Gemmataceae bacterium]|nr:CPBP family intramembrane metalloprotease [Gemmataceae bacterium]